MNKVCSKCKIEKNISDFRTCYDKRRGKCYVLVHCKNCEHAYARMNTKRWYVKNRDKVKDKYKIEYHLIKDERNKKRRDHYRKNAEKLRKQRRDWAANNPEKTKASSRRSRQNNKEKVEARVRKWITNNLDRVREIKKKNHHIRRMVMYKITTTPITCAEQREIKAKAIAYGKCPFCNKAMKECDWELEHAIPLSRTAKDPSLGGGHCKDNIYYCCKQCNGPSGKFTQTLEEWWGKGIKDIPYLK